MRIAILIPTLGRAEVLPGLLQNIRQTTPPKYTVFWVVDHGDHDTQRVLGEMAPAGDDSMVLCDGSYPVKTNAGADAAARVALANGEPLDQQLVLPTADDTVFHRGWFEAAVRRFDDPGVHVVGTNDLTPATRGGRLATMPIVRRSYIEDPGAAWGEQGTVFHAGLHHNFVDRELWELAQHRGVAVFEPESVIEHRHHGWQTREVDDTDRKGNMRGWDADKALFEQRSGQWT